MVCEQIYIALYQVTSFIVKDAIVEFRLVVNSSFQINNMSSYTLPETCKFTIPAFHHSGLSSNAAYPEIILQGIVSIHLGESHSVGGRKLL